MWLTTLRTLLLRSAPHSEGFAASLGTLTYDLITAHAQRMEASLLLFIPTAMEDFHSSRTGKTPFSLHSRAIPHLTMMTCLTRAVHCPNATRMACRDRLLASLTDLHWVLEIRSGGNMERVLSAQQSHDPRIQWVLKPVQPTAATAGNLHLLDRFPTWSWGFSLNTTNGSTASAPFLPSPTITGFQDPVSSRDHISWHPLPSASLPRKKIILPREISWGRYLYHYTRSCPGPWPGQDDHDYLLSLLDNAPLAGHTALHTLIHILQESRLRGSSRLVRGSEASISFSSRNPGEISKMRQWNPGLIRWTFEPYGLALSRKLLRDHGAKPAIYAGSSVYAQLPDSERFRFQRHEPPGCSWKHEREWRLPHDLSLEGIPNEDCFVFVPRPQDILELAAQLKKPPPVTLISLHGFSP